MKKLFLYSLIIGVLVLVVTYGIGHLTTQPHQFKVTFLDIGQGDSALIQFANGQTMLVDCGANKLVLARLGEVLSFYDRTIDYVLATHPDLDHYGGCVDVLKRYQVKTVIVNGREKPADQYWQAWDQTMRASGAIIKTINSPAVWQIGSSTLDFLSPDPQLPLVVKEDDNNNFSIVFKLTSETGQTFLFTGDMEVPLETALLQRYCPDLVTSTVFKASQGCARLAANVLKVGHHGSQTSSGVDLLQAVRPTIGIISAGKDNHYGHPSRRILKRLERAGAKIRRTDREGDIVIE